MHDEVDDRVSNPFVTRRVRPGAIPYIFHNGQNADALVATLRDAGWRGQIIGPHGSGKTTLLETLMERLVAAGRFPIRYRVLREQRGRTGKRSCESAADRFIASTSNDWGFCRPSRTALPAFTFSMRGLFESRTTPQPIYRDATTLIILDGFEQLSWLERALLSAWCRWHEFGLLVTTHRPMPMPVLYRTVVDPQIARAVINILVHPNDPLVNEQQIASCLHAHRGNMREVLFELYDLYEIRS